MCWNFNTLCSYRRIRLGNEKEGEGEGEEEEEEEKEGEEEEEEGQEEDEDEKEDGLILYLQICTWHCLTS